MRSNIPEDEFPHLKSLGLYAANIIGDGNCLFNALSDQLYGTQESHFEVRARTIDYMREHAIYYSSFMDVLPGGATRRNPKRKTTGGVAASIPTSDQVLDAFNAHLERMSRGGTWGDNMEIAAFAAAYKVNVMIIQRDQGYMIVGEGSDGKTTCYIAYHSWEHYSSVRNLDGPHEGPPHVEVPEEVIQNKFRTPNSITPKLAQPKPTKVPEWQIDNIMTSVSYSISRDAVLRELDLHSGNVDLVIEKLLVEKDNNTPSSSVERDMSDDTNDAAGAPKKKQDRRLSKASNARRRQATRVREEKRRREAVTQLHGPHNDSLDSLLQAETAAQTAVRKPFFSSAQLEILLADSDDESTSPPPPLVDGDTSTSSEYSEEPASQSESSSFASKPSTSAPQSMPSRPTGMKPGKRSSTRDVKIAKKQAQKAAAKERRQLMANTKRAQTSSPLSAENVNHPVVNNGFRLLHI